jgi:hypothetical protein
MIRAATPVMKPTISAFDTQRRSRPPFSNPATNMITPVMSESAKSVPGELPLVTAGTLATTNAMALVVCTLR